VEAWQAPLAHRPNLPQRLLSRIAALVGPGKSANYKPAVQIRKPAPARTAPEWARGSAAERSARTWETPSERARRLYAAGQLTEDMIAMTVDNGQREFAVEARIDPGFEIVEGERDEVLRDRAFERFLAGLTADDERAVLAAFESGVTVKELGQVCRRLADHRDVSEIESAYPDPGPSPDPAPVLAAFRSAVEWMSARKSQCIDRDDAGFAHIEELERVAASGELPRAADLKQKGNQNNWRPKTTITEIKREVAATALLLSGHEAAVAHHRADSAAALEHVRINCQSLLVAFRGKFVLLTRKVRRSQICQRGRGIRLDP